MAASSARQCSTGPISSKSRTAVLPRIRIGSRMALFFDAEWFNARLAAAHLARGDVARALGVSESEIAEVWKDQRELSARDAPVLASLLGVAPADIAHRAGISTPIPRTEPLPAD